MHNLINLQYESDKYIFQNHVFWISLLLATQKIVTKIKTLRLKLSKWAINNQSNSVTSLNYKSLQDIETYLNKFNDQGSAIPDIINFESKTSKIIDAKQRALISNQNKIQQIPARLKSYNSRWIMEAEKNVLTTGLIPKTIYDITQV